MRHFMCSLATLLAMALSASAQNRWIVGPGGFSTLDAAYQAAGPGDWILIRVPSLGISTLDGKGVRIIGDGVTPVLDPLQASAPYYSSRFTAIIRGIPVAQEMYLENLRINGTLKIESCTGSVIVNRVVARRSIHDDYQHGLEVLIADHVHCIDSVFAGNVNLVPPCRGGATGIGISVARANAYFERCTIEEGPTGQYYCGMTWPFLEYFWSSMCAFVTGGTPSSHHVVLSNCAFVSTAGEQLYVQFMETSISSPTPPLLIHLDYADVEGYGPGVTVIGNGAMRNHGRILPQVATQLSSSGVTIQGSYAEANTPVFLGVSDRCRLYAFEPIGHLGMSVLDFDRAHSALLDVAVSDASGAWQRQYPLSPQMLLALDGQHYVLQGLNLASDGRIWCSTPQLVRF